MNITSWQTDTTATMATHASDTAATVKKTKHQLTPAEILKWLPKDATPQQQDSAIQAHIKPSPVNWSTRPDTLHLPGHKVDTTYGRAGLPQLYKESFFANDSLYHPELAGGRPGVAGDPVPYTIAGDNLVTGLLLMCFLLTAIVMPRSKMFIIRQIKQLFYNPSHDEIMMTETFNELHLQVFLVLQTCFLASIVFFFRANSPVTGTFLVEQYTMIGLFTAITAGFTILKTILYNTVGSVFFAYRNNIRWMQTYIFILAMQGLLIYPAVLLLAFFHLSIELVSTYTLTIILAFKALSFYKTYRIFFKGVDGYVQNILYFCTLEIMPLLALWGFLQMANNSLKVSL